MRKSQNFDLNLYEGTDIFNPLTNDVPNYEKIDAQMKKNYNLSVGKASELKTGTVHALTRENADCPMIHFTATSNFTSNDTFTLDGVQVSALLVDGSTLPTNCYIIGSEVICYLKGTLLTFFLSGSVSKDSEKLGGELPNYYAKQGDFEQLDTTVASISGIVEKNSSNIVEINNSMKMLVSKTTVNIKPRETIILNGERIGGYYIIFSKGSSQGALGAIVGVGYGETASRHKIHVLIESDVAYRPLGDRYGLQVTNNTSQDVELKIIN